MENTTTGQPEWLNNRNSEDSDFSGYSSDARWEQDCTSPVFVVFFLIMSNSVIYSCGKGSSSELFFRGSYENYSSPIGGGV